MHDPEINDANTSLIRDLIKEKRADRRWKNIRLMLWIALFVYLIASISNLFNASSLPTATGSPYTALIRLDGMIAPGHGFSAADVVPVLEEAFSDRHAAGVVIDINSPGGTPVQASIIHDAILIFKKKYNKKVIVVGEDLLTSGAYFIAVAADKIYVNPNTLTGSIGVIMKGFGFVDAMKKVGIERRVYTIGSDKDRLDPFLPQTQDDVAKVKDVMGEVHQNFEAAVLAGRKGKLRGDPAKLFTGDFWSGQKALELGLVDGLGNLLDTMEKEFKTTHYKEYSSGPALFKMLGDQLNNVFDHLFYT